MVYANKKQTELKVCNEMKSKTSKGILPFHKDLKTIMSEWFDIHPQKHVISDEDGSYIQSKAAGIYALEDIKTTGNSF